MAKPKGAPNPFVVSHASYPGPLGAPAERFPATIWAARSSCSFGTPAGSIATTAGSAARSATSAADRSRNWVRTRTADRSGASFGPSPAASARASAPGVSGHRLHGHAAALRPTLDLVGRAQGGRGTYRGV